MTLTIILHIILILLFLGFTDCDNKSNPSASSGATVNAWDAPCGNLIQGVTLADGWSNLCEVPSPILIGGGEGWTDSAAITPNGLSLYFGYSRMDFGNFMDSSGATQTPYGPTRTGMTGTDFKMFRADLSSSGWTVNYLPFNGDPNVNEASASPNAAQDTVVFTRFDSSGVGTLFYSTLTSGSWSTPVAFPTSPAVNTTDTSCTNDNGFIIGSFSTGFTLYFESSRNDLAGTTCRGDGTSRLYQVTYSAGTYSNLQEVPGLDGNLTSESDTQISLTVDKSQVYFTRLTNAEYGVFTGTLSGGTYGNIHQIVTPTFTGPFTGNLVDVGEANVATTSQGSLLYMMCGIAQSETQQHDPSIRACFAKK